MTLDARNVLKSQYTLILESFDKAGGVFSTLKSDTITISILEPPLKLNYEALVLTVGQQSI